MTLQSPALSSTTSGICGAAQEDQDCETELNSPRKADLAKFKLFAKATVTHRFSQSVREKGKFSQCSPNKAPLWTTLQLNIQIKVTMNGQQPSRRYTAVVGMRLKSHRVCNNFFDTFNCALRVSVGV